MSQEEEIGEKSAQRVKLLQHAKQLTTSPGVYLLKDGDGLVLYVGKAKSLKSRVSSYFQPARHDSARIEMLVHLVRDIEVILTETESEALILEATLIKKNKPKFNVRLKDDKAYPYIKVNSNEEAPRLLWTRKVKKDGARYFGPFPSAWSARQVMRQLNETFRLRDCSDNTYRHRSRPCILYQMEKCSAPCVKKISESEYLDQIEEVMRVLEGKSDSLSKGLEEKMLEASEGEDFETAAYYRDQLKNLELVTQTQAVLEAGVDRSRDIVSVAQKDDQAHAALLQIRSGKLIAVRHYDLQNVDGTFSVSELLLEFLTGYYVSLEKELEKKSKSEEQGSYQSRPDEVLVSTSQLDVDWLEKGLGVVIREPESEEESRLVKVATQNAEHALSLKKARAKGHGLEALEEVQKKLHLFEVPHRIECYDISNIQGTDAVASRVVFIDGAPDKNLYRRYKIKTVEGSNDFAMMKEVLERRLTKQNEELPNLIVVDGGKGQLSQGVAILEELNIQGVEIVGLAKARSKSDFKEKEVESTQERIFIPNRRNPVSLLPHQKSFKLLTHLRDEAHRFAVNYHRHLRSKRLGGSAES